MMKRLALSLVALAVAVPAVAQQAAPEAGIAFARTISDFRPDGRDAIYLRAGRQWYRGTFIAPCHELPWAWGVRFDARGGIGGVDRYSTLLVRDERCQLASLVKIEGKPPIEKVKPKKKPD